MGRSPMFMTKPTPVWGLRQLICEGGPEVPDLGVNANLTPNLRSPAAFVRESAAQALGS